VLLYMHNSCPTLLLTHTLVGQQNMMNLELYNEQCAWFGLMCLHAKFC
jgi:hypothetical protein